MSSSLIMAANLTPTEKVEKLEAKEEKRKAQGKAAKLRLIEMGSYAIGSLGSGYLITKKPDLASFGPGGKLSLDLLLAGGGLLLAFMGKGSMREVGSGLLYAGASPMLRSAGAKAAT